MAKTEQKTGQPIALPSARIRPAPPEMDDEEEAVRCTGRCFCSGKPGVVLVGCMAVRLAVALACCCCCC